MEHHKDTYQGFSCSYYDQLEAYSIKRIECVIVFRGMDGEQNIKGIIDDLFAQEGAEYLKLNNGTIIRLDRLISINGVPVDNVC